MAGSPTWGAFNGSDKESMDGDLEPFVGRWGAVRSVAGVDRIGGDDAGDDVSFDAADLSTNWDGDAFDQVLLLRGETGQTMNREFSSDPKLRQMPDMFLHSSNLSGPFQRPAHSHALN